MQCSTAGWIDRGDDIEKERRAEETVVKGNIMMGRSLSIALRIIWLHALAWGIEWNEVGWHRGEVSRGQ